MMLLDLPIEVLYDILSYNLLPYTLRVCKELYEIEEDLHVYRRGCIYRRYCLGNDYIVNPHMILEDKDMECMRMCIHYNMFAPRYHEYIIHSIPSIMSYTSTSLCMRILMLYTNSIDWDIVIMMSRIGGKCFWYCMNRLEEDMEDEHMYAIFDIAAIHSHLDIIEYLICNYGTGILTSRINDGIHVPINIIIYLLENIIDIDTEDIISIISYLMKE